MLKVSDVIKNPRKHRQVYNKNQNYIFLYLNSSEAVRTE